MKSSGRHISAFRFDISAFWDYNILKEKNGRRSLNTEVNMKFGYFTVGSACFFSVVFSAEACTSWVLRPEETQSGRMIIQKILDERYTPRLDADIRVAPNGWRWIRIGRNAHGASMTMNEKGVALTTNSADRNGENRPFYGERHAMGSGELQRLVAKNCATAAEGVELVKRAARNRLFVYSSINFGTILLIADAHRAFLVEIGDGYAESYEITNGIHVATNTWRLPGGEVVSECDFPGVRGDRARYDCAVKSLREKRVDGKYTVRGCFDTSRNIRRRQFVERHPFVPGNPKSKFMSLETTCFEIDAEFPAFLSCAYISLGPQRHMVYLPVAMAVKQLPDKMRDGRWGKMAYDHQAAFGPEHADLPKIAALEDKFLAEFTTVRDRARELLRDGKKAEAVKLLNDCFDRQYAEADELMTSLQTAAQEKLKTAHKAE